jgi:hypothetical protein
MNFRAEKQKKLESKLVTASKIAAKNVAACQNTEVLQVAASPVTVSPLSAQITAKTGEYFNVHFIID